MSRTIRNILPLCAASLICAGCFPPTNVEARMVVSGTLTMNQFEGPPIYIDLGENTSCWTRTYYVHFATASSSPNHSFYKDYRCNVEQYDTALDIHIRVSEEQPPSLGRSTAALEGSFEVKWRNLLAGTAPSFSSRCPKISSLHIIPYFSITTLNGHNQRGTPPFHFRIHEPENNSAEPCVDVDATIFIPEQDLNEDYNLPTTPPPEQL